MQKSTPINFVWSLFMGYLIVSFLCLGVSCSHLSGLFSSKESTINDANSTNAGDANDPNKMPKIDKDVPGAPKEQIYSDARYNDMNRRLKQIEHKLQLLEEGLTLGIIPEELKHDIHPSSGDSSKNGFSQSVSDRKPSDLAALSLDDGVRHFNQKKYEKAFAVFEGLENSPEIDIAGAAHYWKAKVWFELKDYQSCESVLKEFNTKYPTSNVKLDAELLYGLVSLELKNLELASSTLRKIIQESPDSSQGKKATEIIQHMERKM